MSYYKTQSTDIDSLWKFLQKKLPKMTWKPKPHEPPPNFRRATEKEFVKGQFFSYTPEFVSYQQVLPSAMPEPLNKELKGAQDLVCFWFYDGSGIALTRDYWKGTVQYFQFEVCEHNLVRTQNDRMFLHEEICTKCGWVYCYDSSG